MFRRLKDVFYCSIASVCQWRLTGAFRGVRIVSLSPAQVPLPLRLRLFLNWIIGGISAGLSCKPFSFDLEYDKRLDQNCLRVDFFNHYRGRREFRFAGLLGSNKTGQKENISTASCHRIGWCHCRYYIKCQQIQQILFSQSDL